MAVIYNGGDICVDNVRNLSLELIKNKDDILASESYAMSFFSEINSDYEEMTHDEKIEYGIENIDMFIDSGSYYDMLDSYEPIASYYHTLELEATEAKVAMLQNLTGALCIIRREDLQIDTIALISGGMDMSDCIELAFYVIDGKSGVKASQVMSLGITEEKLLWYCRYMEEKNGRVLFCQIETFLKERDFSIDYEKIMSDREGFLKEKVFWALDRLRSEQEINARHKKLMS